MWSSVWTLDAFNDHVITASYRVIGSSENFLNPNRNDDGVYTRKIKVTMTGRSDLDFDDLGSSGLSVRGEP